ncbi:MAG TPA: oligosaccharide flippase family protein [Gemmatimonadales bacterium]|nr:oligosaccharide flippase family protein [Gemmatimonadales bacterium]
MPTANGRENCTLTSPIDARHELKRGLWWMGGATLAMRLLDVAGTLIVLQFLGPREMGVATLAWSLSVAMEAFNGLGVGQVLVRQKEMSHRELSGLFWFCTLLGLAAVAVMAAVAPFVAVFYADWRLYPMIVVAATKLIFVGAALVPLQLLTRDLDFKTSGAAQTIATLGESVTKVVLVLAGLGAWGLVLANAGRGLFLMVALWRLAPFRPSFTAADDSTRRSIRFGLRVAAGSIIYQVYRNMDFLLVGRFLGTSAVGIYRVAWDLGMTPLEIVVNLVNRVQYPIYAKLQEHAEELKAAFYRSAQSLLLTLGPVVALICFASPDILSLIGHGRWLAAAPLVQILVWASLLRGVAQLFPALYIATGHPHYTVYDSLVTGGTLVLGFLLALVIAPPETATIWVALVWLLSYPLALALHFTLVRRTAPITPGSMARSLASAALGLLVMSLVLAVASTLRALVGSPVLTLVMLVTVGLATYMVFLRKVLHLKPGHLLPRRAEES